MKSTKKITKSTKANTAHGNTTYKKKNPKRKKLFLILGLVFVVVGLLVFINNKKNKTITSNPNIPKEILELIGEDNLVHITVLNAKVVWNKDIFRVVNLENRTWEKCTFELNRGLAEDVFSFQQATVDAGSKLDINHSEFKNNVGESYEYEKTKL